MKKLILLVITLFICSSLSYGASQMRKCLLLPIEDSLDGAIAFNIFQEVEQYLKESNWCYYKTNSDLINILGNYKNNLKSHLSNPKVLKVISQKTNSGSMIKISVPRDQKGIKLSLKVIGENGNDIYFSKTRYLKSRDNNTTVKIIKLWLNQFAAQIPYDGIILGVLGNQFTVVVGSQFDVLTTDKISIVRPIRKKQHPLLKEIVDWDTLEIGTAKILKVNQSQSHASVVNYETKKRLKVGDWIRVKRDIKVSNNNLNYKNIEYKHGRLGQASFNLVVGIGDGEALVSSSSNRSLGGVNYGGDLKLELWMTRNIFLGATLGKKFGSYSADQGTFNIESQSPGISYTKIYSGFKYLPINYFYGPQINFYAGYGIYNYSFQTNTTDGFTEFDFSGPLFGTSASIPLMNIFRIYLTLDFLLAAEYEEVISIYGSEDSISSYNAEFGAKYNYKKNITIDGSFSLTSNKAKFRNPTQQITLKDKSVNMGMTFTY